MVVRTMEGELPFPPRGCITELFDTSSCLNREGFWRRPSWPELQEGKRPPENTTGELGEWQHGWRYWASSVSDSHFRKITMLSVRSAASRAHLRSHSGLNAGAALAYAPTAPEHVIPRAPVPCAAFGEAPTSTPRRFGGVLWLPRSFGPSGAPPSRMRPHRQTQEAGDPSRADAGSSVSCRRSTRAIQCVLEGHERADDVLKFSLKTSPCFGGCHLAIDITLRSALSSSGEPQPNAAHVDGAVLARARVERERPRTPNW